MGSLANWQYNITVVQTFEHIWIVDPVVAKFEEIIISQKLAHDLSKVGSTVNLHLN